MTRTGLSTHKKEVNEFHGWLPANFLFLTILIYSFLLSYCLVFCISSVQFVFSGHSS